MKAFEQMTHDEQTDHLLHEHGLADAEELMMGEDPDSDPIEAHAWEHGTLSSGEDHEHDDQEAMERLYVEMVRGQ